MAGKIGAGIGGFLGAAHGTAEGLSELNEGRKTAVGYLQNWKPIGFSGGSYGGSYADGNFTLSQTQAGRDALSGTMGAYSDASNRFGQLAGFSPYSFSNLQFNTGSGIDPLSALPNPYEATKITLAGSRAALESSRRRAIGNLRDNLQRRRVLGSSFGQDALTRAEAEFGLQEAQIAEQEDLISLDEKKYAQQDAFNRAGFLQSEKQFQESLSTDQQKFVFEQERQRAQYDLEQIRIRGEFVAQQSKAAVDGMLTQLNQLNLEGQMAANFANSINSIMAANTQLSANLTAELYAARAGLWANWQQSHLNMLEGAVGGASASGGGGGGGLGSVTGISNSGFTGGNSFMDTSSFASFK